MLHKNLLFLPFFSYFVCFYIFDSVTSDNSNFKFWEPALSNCLSHLMLIKSMYLYISNNYIVLFVNPPTWEIELYLHPTLSNIQRL